MMKTVSEVVASSCEAAVKAVADQYGYSISSVSTEVERPANPGHGDYATNIAMRLARPWRKSPLDIAKAIAEHISDDIYASVEAARPGFVNFRLAPAWVARQAGEIVRAGGGFGRSERLAGKTLQVEFISANPTGPLTLANARGGPLGDVLAEVLAFNGARIVREYYVEDTGTQFEVFGRSIAIRYRQLFGEEIAVPPDGYPADYVKHIAAEIKARDGDRYLAMSLEEQAREFVKFGVDWVVRDARRVAEKFGIRYDHWFSQAELMRSGVFAETLAELRRLGKIYDRDGAVWFEASQEIDDKEGWVVVRSNGEPTYFGKDIAYHRLSLTERGVDVKVDIWGANTHYHVIRMREAMKALGFGEERWRVVLYQYVRFLHEGALVRMGRRLGQFITLEDVLEGVGKDATRFFLLQRSADAQLDFDFELALQQSNENPVYYAQYAHARIASIFRMAREKGIDWADADAALLTEQPEQELVLACLRFPDLVREIGEHFGVHLLTQYAVELAGLLHSFYKFHRVISDDVARTKARLLLMAAVQATLRQTLGLLGIAAPESM